MKLLTKALREKLLANGARPGADHKPPAKLFFPAGAATWLLTHLDPEDPDIAGCLADLGMGYPEIGSVRISELAAFRGRFGLGIERDLHFRPKFGIRTYAEAARAAGRIIERGPELEAAANGRKDAAVTA